MSPDAPSPIRDLTFSVICGKNINELLIMAYISGVVLSCFQHHSSQCSQLHIIRSPPSKIPAYLHVTDIAGLIRGASEGAGLGNAFLSHIQAVDGLYHVVRAFDNPEVVHVDDSVVSNEGLLDILTGGVLD